MDKRVTIKDVAKAAGVSVATVSYVLNNRQDQKISAATRTRVLQTVTEMGYTAARPIRTADRRTGCVALCSCAPDGSLLKFDHGIIIEQLVCAIESAGLFALHLSLEHCEKIRRADALICIDASEEQFRRMTLHNSIPVLGLNVVTGSAAQVSVCCDYTQVMRHAQSSFGFDFCIVTCEPPNHLLREHIASACGRDIYFCSEISDLTDFLRHNGDRPLAVCSPSAYNVCAAAGAHAELIYPDLQKLCGCIAECARQASLGHRNDSGEQFMF